MIVFIVICCLILLAVAIGIMINGIECPNCDNDSVSHSHTEQIGCCDIEVYECKNCKSKFV